MADGEEEAGHLTYSELDNKVRAFAATMQQKGLKGERALLLFPPGLDYVVAFMACLYAGVIAVPAYPPRKNRSIGRLKSILIDCQAKAALTDGYIYQQIEKTFEAQPQLSHLHWLVPEKIDDALASQWTDPGVTHDDIAFLQYTSGSTGNPKGVMVSHGNLMHNQALLEIGLHNHPGLTYVTWLPIYHDMGLIGNILQSLYLGGHMVMMSPVDFLRKPVRWLKAISKYKAHSSGGPNFAYQLCVNKVTDEEMQGLDLSSWDTAFNGAEPVREDTIQQFAERFKAVGFNAQAHKPCYGLAEATLLVSMSAEGTDPTVHHVSLANLKNNTLNYVAPDHADAHAVIGCGEPTGDLDVRIVNPDTFAPCADSVIGEIWIAGGSVAKGYWQNEAKTKEDFHATIAGDASGQHYLRTGDLGFMRDGEIYVSGRRKDLIIINGRNHYPQDIEHTVETSSPGLRAGCNAAFSADLAGEERLVVVQELERTAIGQLDYEAVYEQVQQQVYEQHEVQLYALVLIRTGAIAKTSSGKIQRRATKQMFLNGQLDVAWSSTMPFDQYNSQPLIALFEQQTMLNPNRTALVENGQPVTFNELNRKANAIAHYLLGQPAATASKVALCMANNAQMVAALLAIMKTGKTYIPLPCCRESEQLQQYLVAQGIPVVVTGNATWPEGTEAYYLNDLQAEISKMPATNPGIAVALADDLCHILHIKNGQPSLQHISSTFIALYCNQLDNRVGFSHHDTVLVLGQSESHLEMIEKIWALNKGARIVFNPVATDDAAANQGQDALAEMIDQQQVSVVYGKKQALQNLMQQHPPKRKFKAVFPDKKNGLSYSPVTEDTIFPNQKEAIWNQITGNTQPAGNSPAGNTHEAQNTSLKKWVGDEVLRIIATTLGTHPRNIALNKSFHSMGVSSIKGVEAVNNLGEYFGIALPATLLFEAPTLARLIDQLIEDYGSTLLNRMNGVDAEAVGTLNTTDTQVGAQPTQTTATNEADLDDMEEDELAQLLAAELKKDNK